MSSHDPNAAPAVAVPPEHARQQDPVAAAKSAGNDAAAVLRELVTDPFAALGHASAAAPQAKLGMAAVFAAVFVLCSAVAGSGLFGVSATVMLRTAFIGAGALAGVVGGLFLSRALFRGQGDPVTDVLAAGIALLPYGAALLVAGFISWWSLSMALLAIAMSFATILLFSHLEGSGLQKRQALWGVGITWVVFGIASRIFFGLAI